MKHIFSLLAHASNLVLGMIPCRNRWGSVWIWNDGEDIGICCLNHGGSSNKEDE